MFFTQKGNFMKISDLRDMKGMSISESFLFLETSLVINSTYKTSLMEVFDFDEDLYGEFNHIHESVLYNLEQYKEDLNPEIVFQGFIKFFLERYFYNLPTTNILVDWLWDDVEDISYVFTIISRVFDTHKDSINDPEQFFLSVFKDLILSEELARIVTLDENKLKEEPYFKRAILSYDALKQISSIFYEQILKIYQCNKA